MAKDAISKNQLLVSHQLDGPWKGKEMASTPKGVIIHAMGEYVNHQYAPDFLRGIGLSVHAFIAVDGKVMLAAGMDRVAYHAGKSAFRDLEDLNHCFLGVELLVKGHHNMASFKDAIAEDGVYSDGQYESLANLCAYWIKKFEIEREFIVGHTDVAGPSIRRDPKYDPGAGFDWQKFNRLLDQALSSPPSITFANES